jgi:hypothetical protein
MDRNRLFPAWATECVLAASPSVPQSARAAPAAASTPSNQVLEEITVASTPFGQPQGIAVYEDGVRINDPFGDVVIPGSKPVFGLNALGGAISLRHLSRGRHANGSSFVS